MNFQSKKEKFIRSPFYRLPVEKVAFGLSDLIFKGITKIPGVVEKKKPIALIQEQDKDGKNIGRPREYTSDKIIDDVLEKIRGNKLQKGILLSDLTDKDGKPSDDGKKRIRGIIDDLCRNELIKRAKQSSTNQTRRFVDVSNESFQDHNGNDAGSWSDINEARDKFASEVHENLVKYLSSKPKGKQFLEDEDFDEGKSGVFRIRKYIDDRTKRKDTSYAVSGAIIMTVASLAITTIIIGMANPIALAVGIAVLSICAIAFCGMFIYKNRDKIKGLTETIDRELIRRSDEIIAKGEKEVGQTTTSGADLNTVVVQGNNIAVPNLDLNQTDQGGVIQPKNLPDPNKQINNRNLP